MKGLENCAKAMWIGIFLFLMIRQKRTKNIFKNLSRDKAISKLLTKPLKHLINAL